MTDTETTDESLFDDGTGADASADTLAQIVALAEQMTELDGEISKLDASKKAFEAKRTNIAEVLLPEALANARMKDFTLEDGRKIGLKEDLKITVPKVRMAQICDWLRKDKNGDLVSNVVTVDIPKGKDNEVARLQDAAKELGFEATRTESVHATSLKALLNRKLKDGINVDLAFFGAFSYKRAEITEK